MSVPPVAGPPTRLRDLFPGAGYFPQGADPVGHAARRDAALVQRGDIFVHFDAFCSQAAADADARGAAAIVTERLLPGIAAPQVLVEDCRSAYQVLVDAAQAEASQSNSVAIDRVAITGADGADRVATLVAACLASAGNRVGLLTDRVEDDGEHCLPRGHDGSADAGAWFRRCTLGGVDRLVTQLGPEHGTTLPANAEIVCLTDLRCDRLDASGEPAWSSVASQRDAIFGAAAPLAGDATLIVNGDDPDAIRVAATHRGRVLTFGSASDADIHAIVAEEHSGGQTLVVTAGSESVGLEIPRRGDAARRDAVAAIATALVAGLELEQAAVGVSLAPWPETRMQPVVAGQAFPVYLDVAMRPIALAESLHAATCDGRRFAVVRLAEDRSVARRQLATASRLADRVFVTGWDASLGMTPDNVTTVDDRIAGIAVAVGLADSGDAVLVAGSEDGPGEPCDDRAAVEDLLRRRLACQTDRLAA